MNKIDNFRANFAGGGARPTQFECVINFPSWVGGSPATNKLAFMVRATTLPASIITPIDVPFRGRIAKIAGERQFGNWNVTVLNDNDFVIRSTLERWSKGILDHSSTVGRVQPTSYTANMIVRQLDRNDVMLKEYKFYNCFPQMVSEIQLDYGQVNAVEEFGVEFSVDYWETAEAGQNVPT